MKPEVVQSTEYASGCCSASNVLILGDEDDFLEGKETELYNYWVAERASTTGQGFTLKVDNCSRLITGFQIMNKGKGFDNRLNIVILFYDDTSHSTTGLQQRSSV